jgi:hypothetical protein
LPVEGSPTIGLLDQDGGTDVGEDCRALPMNPTALAYQPRSSPALLSAGRTSTSICTTPGTRALVTFCCHCQFRPAYSMSSLLVPAVGTVPESLTVSMRFNATHSAKVLL